MNTILFVLLFCSMWCVTKILGDKIRSKFNLYFKNESNQVGELLDYITGFIILGIPYYIIFWNL